LKTVSGAERYYKAINLFDGRFPLDNVKASTFFNESKSGKLFIKNFKAINLIDVTPGLTRGLC
jgi:hypothetical protein